MTLTHIFLLDPGMRRSELIMWYLENREADISDEELDREMLIIQKIIKKLLKDVKRKKKAYFHTHILKFHISNRVILLLLLHKLKKTMKNKTCNKHKTKILLLCYILTVYLTMKSNHIKVIIIIE